MLSPLFETLSDLPSDHYGVVGSLNFPKPHCTTKNNSATRPETSGTSERGYPDSILSKALNRVQNVNRESALEPSASDNEERIPFTLTFHPNNLAARKRRSLRNFKILQSDPETAPIFP